MVRLNIWDLMFSAGGHELRVSEPVSPNDTSVKAYEITRPRELELMGYQTSTYLAENLYDSVYNGK